MAIECQVCNSRLDKVHFRRPYRAPWTVWVIGIILAAAAASTLWNIVQLLPFALGLNIYKETVIDSTNLLLGLARDNLLLDPDPAENEHKVKVAADAIRIMLNAAFIFFIITLGAITYIIVRYMILIVGGLRKGNPRTWVVLRQLAVIQMLVEGAMIALQLLILQNLETIRYQPGAGPNAILAPLSFIILHLRPTREYFSYHKLVAKPHTKHDPHPPSPKKPKEEPVRSITPSAPAPAPFAAPTPAPTLPPPSAPPRPPGGWPEPDWPPKPPGRS